MKQHPLATILCQLPEVACLLEANFNTLLFFSNYKLPIARFLDHYNSTTLAFWHHVAEIVLTVLSHLKSQILPF